MHPSCHRSPPRNHEGFRAAIASVTPAPGPVTLGVTRHTPSRCYAPPTDFWSYRWNPAPRRASDAAWFLACRVPRFASRSCSSSRAARAVTLTPRRQSRLRELHLTARTTEAGYDIQAVDAETLFHEGLEKAASPTVTVHARRTYASRTSSLRVVTHRLPSTMPLSASNRRVDSPTRSISRSARRFGRRSL